MKKVILMAVLAAAALSSAFGQVIHDPNDELYADLDRWAVRGYVSMLPPVRPYPVQLLEELLKSVARNGDARARSGAETYLAAIAPGSRAVHVGGVGTVRGMDDDISLEGAPTLDGSLLLEDWLGFSYSLAIYGATRKVGKEIDVPGTYSPYPDLIPDNAKVGPFNIMQNWQTTMSVGSSALYFQAGLTRSSFGPFFDNGVVVGPQAGRAGHFSAVYRKPKFSISAMLLEISATDTLGLGQAEGEYYPDKHLILHSIDFAPTPRLEIGIYESVVWGGRFEFQYLNPLNQYFAAQSLAGFDDNSLVGVHGRWKAADGFHVLGDLYLDDLSFNDLMKLKLLDTKYKLAAELGARWAPRKSLVSDVAVDYTAVMPYMYTHIAGERTNRYAAGNVNYYNYTNRGQIIGTDLDPNSDRLSARVKLNLPRNFGMSLSAGMSRHGNASEDVDGITDTANHDGDVNDDGYTDVVSPAEPKNTYNKETRFLTQDTIETKVNAGFGFSYTLPTPVGSMTAEVNYVYEYGWNRDLVDGDDGAAHYYAITGTWRW